MLAIVSSRSHNTSTSILPNLIEFPFCDFILDFPDFKGSAVFHRG